MEEETEFSAEDLSLATVPGLQFDPRQRSFGFEELKPQPIIKKRRKLFTKDSNKVLSEFQTVIVVVKYLQVIGTFKGQFGNCH